MGKEVNSNAVNLLCEGTMIVGDVKTKNEECRIGKRHCCSGH